MSSSKALRASASRAERFPEAGFLEVDFFFDADFFPVRFLGAVDRGRFPDPDFLTDFLRAGFLTARFFDTAFLGTDFFFFNSFLAIIKEKNYRFVGSA